MGIRVTTVSVRFCVESLFWCGGTSEDKVADLSMNGSRETKEGKIERV